MEQNIKRYRAITIVPQQDGTCQIHDPEMGKIAEMKMSQSYLSDISLHLNKAGIQIEAQASGPNYSYVFLTTDFNTPLL